MDNNKKKSNKLKIFTLILMILLVLTGTSYAIITWSYEGKTDNLLSTPDISFRFLESNKEVIGIENGVPMTDEQGMNQTGTGNVFDFEVKSKFNANTDVKYTVSLEKLTIDSGKTQIPEDEIKIYVEDFEGKTVLKPTKISDLDNYNLFIKTDRHSKDNEEISSKYRLKVWLDESVDVFTNQNRQYKFKINVGTTEQEQNKDQTYNLVYNLNGGTGNISSTSFKVGNKVTITSTVPTKDGYKFLGWSTNKNNSNAEYTSGEQVSLTNAYNNTVTLYAIWQGDITYTVKYNPNGGYVKNITTVEPDVNYDPNNYGDTPWITENGIYKSNNQGTDSSYSSLWHSIEIDKETTLSFEVAVSSEQNDGLSININNSTDGSKTYSKILYGNSNINNEINLSYENIDVTLQKGTYLLSFEYTKNSTLSEGLDRAYVKNIKLSSTSDETIEDSIFKSGTNKLTKNIYVRDHYIFKGWSLNKDATIATYQDEQEVDNLTKKNNDIVNLYAIWEKEKYAVNVVVQNGTVDTSSKQISYNESGTFNLTKTIEDTIGTVTCTNNQTGKIENNILTVSNVSRDTTCTVIFKEAITTLYEDGTLIINESVKNRNTNSSTHGSITKEYDAMDENNSYIFKSECIPDKGCISNSLWNNEKDSILSVEIGKNMSPLSTANWFIEHTNLKDGNFKNLDTSNVTDMSFMFKYAGKSTNTFELTGLENWNTSSVTDMSNMFYNAGERSTTWSIGDLSKWDTSSVTDMSHMFYLAGPQATTWSIGDLSKWDTSKVTDMSYMFASAGKSATTFDLNLSKWDTSSVTNMRYMFDQAGSSATTWTVKIPSKTGDSTNTTSRWYGSSSRVYATPCSGKSFTLNYDVNAVIQGGGLAEGESATKSVSGGSNVTFNLVPNSTGSSASVTCTNNQTGSVTNNILTVTNVSASTTCTVIFSSDSTSTVLYNDGTLIINENSTNRNSNITTHGAVVKEYEPMSNSNSYVFELSGPEGDIPHPNYPWLNEKSSVKKVEIGQRIKPVSTAYWNAYLENMESGDFTNLDTSSVTDMEGMFMYAGTSGYINVFTLVGLSNFNVSSVNNMTTLFLGTGLGAKTWNIGDLSNWDVSNVTSMGGMFSSAALNATSFNIGNLSNWDVSNVTDMVEMFSNFDDDGTPGNQQEWYVGDISKWKPLNATDMSRMFMYVGYNVDDFSLDLSNWDVSNVTDMTNMFYNVGYNSSTFNLNLSNWNMSNVETVDGMFEEIGESASDWTLTIPSSTGSIDNDEEHLYGSSSSIYVEPPTGKSFTLA